jgi:adenosine deaminase
LWAAPENFTVGAACAGERLGGEAAGAACREFLQGSEKARLEWKEEVQLAAFEAKF